MKRDKVFNIIIYGFAILMIIGIVYPLWFILIASFSDASAVSRGDIWIWPKAIQFDAYQELLKQPTIWKSYLNTIVYCVVGTIFQLCINLPAGFVMSRKFIGKKFFTIFLIIPMFIGGGLIPTYLVIKALGLLNTRLVLIVPFSVSCYNIIVIRTFFKQNIPETLWEAAQMDGCSVFRYFIQIVLPLSKAIIAVVGLWVAVGIWNSWFESLIYVSNEDYQPLQLVLRRILISNQSLLGDQTGEAARMALNLANKMKYAAIVISTVPIMMLYPFLQKYFNQGVMVGSIKE